MWAALPDRDKLYVILLFSTVVPDEAFALAQRCDMDLTIARVDLSAAVDVYSDWIDACDTVAKDAAEPTGGRGEEGVVRGRGESEGLGIVDDEVDDAEADYGEDM